MMTMPPLNSEPGGAYELGRMAEALAQNTRMLIKLTEAVEENSRTTAQLASRQNRMEAAIESIQADQKKMISLSMTGHTNEVEVRRRLEFLDRMYQKEQDTQGVRKHGRSVLYGAIVLAVFWWCFGVAKEALIAEAATQIQSQSEIRNNQGRK